MTQMLNQFGMTPEKGQFAYDANRNAISVRVWEDSTEEFTPAMAVTIKDVVGHQIVVEKAASGDPIFGFVVYNFKKNKYYAGEIMEVSLDSTFMFMEANAAIEAGEDVIYMPSEIQVAPGSGDAIIGTSLRKAEAQGDLVVVHLDRKRPVI